MVDVSAHNNGARDGRFARITPLRGSLFPSFFLPSRRDLDLVAIAPEGAIAAFCTIWFDDVTRSAYFELVATVPSHQRKGLGKAVMTEGLCRLQRMGATTAFVNGYSLRANALYRSVMGSDHDLYEP